MYNEKVMKTFKEQKHFGEMKDYSGLGKVGNPRCGDLMWIYIKVGVRDGEEFIKDVKIKTFGCVAAIATSSTMAEMAIGKSLKEARKITNKNVAENLGGLPPIKLHCSNLAADGLISALDDYEKRKKKIN